MKVEIFTPVSYYGPVDAHTWPTPPRQYDPVHGMRSMEHGFEQCEAAFEAGFDSLNFAEHHYSINQLSPSPIFYCIENIGAVAIVHVPSSERPAYRRNAHPLRSDPRPAQALPRHAPACIDSAPGPVRAQRQGVRMRARWVLALTVTLTALLAGSVSAASATDPVTLGSSHVVDDAGVLSAAETQDAENRLTQLSDETDVDLWVVFVDDFTNPSDAGDWAQQTATANGLGPNQYLLAVAVAGTPSTTCTATRPDR